LGIEVFKERGNREVRDMQGGGEREKEHCPFVFCLI